MESGQHRRVKKGLNRERAGLQRRQLQQCIGRRARRELMNKRRRMMAPSSGAAADGKGAGTSSDLNAFLASPFVQNQNQNIMNAQRQQTQVEEVQKAIKGFRESKTTEERCKWLGLLTKMLSFEGEEPYHLIDIIIKEGLVQDLTDIVGSGTKSADLQMHAAWCLTNIASGTSEQTQSVVPACPAFIQALTGSNVRLREHAVWALGNIAGDSEELRDTVIKMGVFLPLSQLLKNTKEIALARTICWALSNLLKGRKSCSSEFYKHEFLPSFARLLQVDDEKTLTEVCWCLAYLTSRDETGTAKLIDLGFFGGVLKVAVAKPPVALLIPVLRTLGNFLAYNDHFNSKLLATNGVAEQLLGILALCVKNDHRGIRKEAIWAVGNILAGPVEHVAVVTKAGFLPILLDLLKSSQFDIQREAVYALYNAAKDSHEFVLPPLVQNGLIAPVLALINIDDVDTIMLCVSFVDLILEKHKNGVELVEQAGGIEALETVQTHPNPDLWDRAGKIVDRYWGEDAVVDDYKGTSNHTDEQEQVEYPNWRLGAHQQQMQQQQQNPSSEFPQFSFGE